MNLQDLRSKPHLSTSAINDYTECGLLYYLGRIEKNEPQFISDSLIFGSCIHKVLEQFHRARSQGKQKTLAELYELFEQFWMHEIQVTKNIQYKDGENAESLLRKGKDILAIYYKQLPHDEFKVVGIELPFTFNLEGIPIPIIGVIDLVEQDPSGTIVITDFKTCSKTYSRDEIDKSLQLTIYYMAAKRFGYSDTEILLRFDCLVKTKIPKFEQFWTVRTEEEEKRATRKIQQVWDGIQKKVFVPNDTSWKCGYCSFKNHCNAWFLKEAG